MSQRSQHLLESLVALPSVYPHEEKVTDFLVSWILTNVGCQVEKQFVAAGRYNVIATKKAKDSSGKATMLAGHQDTVAVVDGWSTNPHEPVTKNGELYGVGSWDMKAGLTIMLLSLLLHEPQRRDLATAFTVDEENYSIGAHALIDAGYGANVDHILVPEPGFSHGDHGVTIGRSGRATVEVTMHGKSAHGSFSEQGINAIAEGFVFGLEAGKLRSGSHPEMGRTTIFACKTGGEATGFSVPDANELSFDVKLVPPDTAESVLELMRQRAEELMKTGALAMMPTFRLKERPTPFCAPYALDPNSSFVQICAEAVRAETGSATVFVRQSVADECIFVKRLGVPTICIGPDGEGAHEANEHVSLASVDRVLATYLRILAELEKS